MAHVKLKYPAKRNKYTSRWRNVLDVDLQTSNHERMVWADDRCTRYSIAVDTLLSTRDHEQQAEQVTYSNSGFFWHGKSNESNCLSSPFEEKMFRSTLKILFWILKRHFSELFDEFGVERSSSSTNYHWPENVWPGSQCMILSLYKIQLFALSTVLMLNTSWHYFWQPVILMKMTIYDNILSKMSLYVTVWLTIFLIS